MARRGPKGRDDSDLLRRMAEIMSVDNTGKIRPHTAAMIVTNNDLSTARRLDKKYLRFYRYESAASVVAGYRVVAMIKPWADLAKRVYAMPEMKRLRDAGIEKVFGDDAFWEFHSERGGDLAGNVELYLRRRPRRRRKSGNVFPA